MKVEPFKSALTRVVKAKLKFLDPQLAAGDIIIPGRTIRYRIKSVKAEADNLGVLSLLYLKNSCCTDKKKMMTSKLDRDYIQELITLRELKNNGMYREEVIGITQTIHGA